MHLRVVLWHAEGAGINAVAAIQTTRLQGSHYNALFRNLYSVRRTNERARRLNAVHTNRRHRRGRLRTLKIIHKYHRVPFVRRTLSARGHTRAAADTTLRVYEHCLFHNQWSVVSGQWSDAISFFN